MTQKEFNLHIVVLEIQVEYEKQEVLYLAQMDPLQTEKESICIKKLKSAELQVFVKREVLLLP